MMFKTKKELEKEQPSQKRKPSKIRIGKNIQLIPFDFLREESLEWYQDPESMQNIIGKPIIYNRSQIRQMYLWQNKNGLLYYIEYDLGGRYKTIGDVWLSEDDYSIVLDKKYRNRLIGRRITRYFIYKSEMMSREYMVVKEIFDWDKISQKMFSNLEFYPYNETKNGWSYYKELNTQKKKSFHSKK